LIWILRNPLPRAISEYLHQAVKNKKYPSFNSLINAEIDAIQYCRRKNKIRFDGHFENSFFQCLGKFRLKKYALSTAFYGFFISAWLKNFPREQHLFLDYEEFRRNPQLTVEKISLFLGISLPPELNHTWKYNKANTREGKAIKKREEISIPHTMRSKLIQELRFFTLPLYNLIGNNFNWTFDSMS